MKHPEIKDWKSLDECDDVQLLQCYLVDPVLDLDSLNGLCKALNITPADLELMMAEAEKETDKE